MRTFTVGLVLGLVSLAWQGALPHAFIELARPPLQLAKMIVPITVTAVAIIAITAMSGLKPRLRRFTRLMSGWLLAYLYGSVCIASALGHRLSACHEREPVTILFEVKDQPRSVSGFSGSANYRFQASVVTSMGLAPDCPSLQGRLLRLGWYGAPELEAGQLWQANVVLRRPWSYANPAGFDYERWAVGHGLAGMGYVRDARSAGTRSRVANGYRRRLDERIKDAGLLHGGILKALVVGDDGGISTVEWDQFRRTGTIHLMVISGLHVGLVAGFALAIGSLLARAVPPLLLWMTNIQAGGLLAMAACAGYVGLAGAEPPALRAMLMASLALFALASGRRLGPIGFMTLVAALVLIANPLVVHLQGFWLSFGAVFTLLTAFRGRIRTTRPIVDVLLAQLALALGMSPLVALWQGSVSWISPLANALVVPFMSLLVIPVALLAAVATAMGFGVAEELLQLADLMLHVCLSLLAVVAALAGSSAEGSLLIVSRLGLLSGALLLVASALLLLGPAPRSLGILVVGWSIWLVPASLDVPNGEFRVTAIDVGQGSAILVDTARQRLLYDTGPRYKGGMDLGAAAVIPALAATGPLRLNTLVLSHDDIDHTGGLDAVLANVRLNRAYASFYPPAFFPPAFYSPGDHPPVLHLQLSRPQAPIVPCGHGESWHADGVTFEFFNDAPMSGFPKATGDDNALSCVLLIRSATRRVLLAGDLPAAYESAVARRIGTTVDVLFAPHHGSKTSSSRAFVEMLRPRLVFVSAGRLNRYGHPHPDVVARYLNIQAAVQVTGLSGALIYDSVDDSLTRWRDHDRPYWRQPGEQPGEQPGSRNSGG